MSTVIDKKRGRNTRLFRQIKGFSQDEIAIKLNMSQQHYSRLESGDLEYSDERKNNVADVLQIDPDLIDNFDENNIFNYCQINNDNAVAYNGPYNNNTLDPEIKRLYEDKIVLLENKIKDQEKIISKLEAEIKLKK